MSLKNKLKNTVLGLTAAGSIFLASCDDGFMTKKAEYALRKPDVQTLDTVNSKRILSSIDDYVANAREFIRNINEPAPQMYTKEDIADHNEYVLESWDSVAQNQYNAIVLSNYLQERARQENELKRFDDKKIAALEDAALKAYETVLGLPFNPLNQQVATGQRVEIKYWDKTKLNTTTISFEGDAYVGYYDSGVKFFPPEPRDFVAKVPSQFSNEEFYSEFEYDARKRMTIGDFLTLAEKNTAAYAKD